MRNEDAIQLLLDIEAIKKLKAFYCYLVDAGAKGDASKIDALVELLADDIVGDYGPLGTYVGKESFRNLFAQMAPSTMPFSAHMVHNPVINVAGDTATGWWYYEIPCSLKTLNTAAWAQGKYEDEYVRVGDSWKFKSIKVIMNYFTTFDKGWVKEQFVQF